METLRFLMVTTFYPPYHVGGDAIHVQDLARALSSRGHEVHVEYSPAAYALRHKPLRGPPPERDDGVVLHPIPGDGWRQPVAAHVLGRSAGVRRFHGHLLDDVRPDVLHHHNISLLGLDVLERRSRTRALYTAHDYWVRCPRSDLFKYGKYPCDAPTCLRCELVSRRPPQLWRYGSGGRGLLGVDCAIAPSQFMARAIQSSVRCPVVHIPNFAPDADPSRVPHAPGDSFLFAGVLEMHKGISELAAACLRRSFPLRVVGRGSLSDSLTEIARRRPNGMHIEGWLPRERLFGLYRTAKALIIPSLSPENAPLTAVEALSCGTPLLVARRGGLPELLHDGATGLSFEPDPEGIVDAVERFERLENPSSLRAGARWAYERYHTPDGYLQRYLDVARGDLPTVPEVRNTVVDPGVLPGAAA